MGFKPTLVSEELMRYLYVTCLLNELGNFDPPPKEKNVFYSKVNESVSTATRGLIGWKSFFMTMKGNSVENLGTLLINIFLWKCYEQRLFVFLNLNAAFFISKEKSSKWFKS